MIKNEFIMNLAEYVNFLGLLNIDKIRKVAK